MTRLDVIADYTERMIAISVAQGVARDQACIEIAMAAARQILPTLDPALAQMIFLKHLKLAVDEARAIIEALNDAPRDMAN